MRRPSVGVRRRALTRGLVFALAATAVLRGAAPSVAVLPEQKTQPETAAFGVQPASKQPGKDLQPDSRGFFAYGVTPNGLLNDHVAFRNYGSKPITVRVYATDAMPTSNGDFALLSSQEKPKDVGSWVTLVGVKSGTLTVPPKSFKVVPLVLKVPADAQPGDHTGAVIASFDTISKNREGANVRFEQRVGSRLKVRVTGPLRPRLMIDGMRASFIRPENPFGKGQLRVVYTVRNAGNVRLGGRQAIRVTGWLGSNAAAEKLADVPELLPGGAIDLTSTVAVPAAGRLSVTVEVEPIGSVTDGDLQLTTVRRTVKLWAFTWAWLLALLVLMGGAYLFWRRRRLYAHSTATQLAAYSTPAPTSQAAAVVSE